MKHHFDFCFEFKIDFKRRALLTNKQYFLLPLNPWFLLGSGHSAGGTASMSKKKSSKLQ